MPTLVEYYGLDNVRAMTFVDGENLAIRFGAHLQEKGLRVIPEAVYRPDIYLWWKELSARTVVAGGAVLRTYYYTAVQADYPTIDEVVSELKQAGVEAPRVFKKVKGSRSKRVDISLATDMLTHASRHHFDVAILVAGDEDYVPLVEAVQAEGRRVHLWSIPSGLSAKLVQAVDHHTDLSVHLARATE